MNKLLPLLLISICWSCTQTPDTEKHQSKRDNVINVRDKIKEIVIEDVLIGRIAQLYLIDNYLIIGDFESPDKLIHLFDKNNFSYLTSTTYQGQGPGEITIMGHIGIDEANRRFFVSDHGKLCIYNYDLDSVLTNPSYMPTVKMKLNERLFPDKYLYINDTLCIGRVIEPIGNADFKPFVAKWNMATGEIKKMPYEHSGLKKKRIISAISMEHGIYIECYAHYDLLTICSLDGDLKYNIYGPKWNSEITQTSHFGLGIAICDNKIFALYSGGDHRTDAYYPTKFLVFNIDGNYLQTLETGYKISNFCYDKENNRIIMVMNDDMQFAYLDLDGIVD